MPTLSLGLCFHLFHFGGCLPYALCLVKIIIPLEPFDSCHGVKRSPFWRADWPKTFSTIRLARNIGGWRWILGSRCFIFLRVVTAAYALDGTLGRFNPDFFLRGGTPIFLVVIPMFAGWVRPFSGSNVVFFRLKPFCAGWIPSSLVNYG